MNHHAGMTLIVKTVTRVMVWMMLLYGMYLILHGHLTPGGGFGRRGNHCPGVSFHLPCIWALLIQKSG